jgi:hypothetical protein
LEASERLKQRKRGNKKGAGKREKKEKGLLIK